MTLGESQIGRLMRAYDVKAKIRQIRKARFVNKNIIREGLPGNLLNRQFYASQPREKLLTDVTYVPYYENGQWHWGYLSLVLDLFDRSIVAWIYSKKQDQQLALNTLRILSFQGTLQGAMLHSDHGSIYTSQAFRTELEKLGMQQSLSRVGNCHDNAPMESFNGTLKVEGLYNEYFGLEQSPSFVQQNQAIERYLEFYNYQRPSSVLNNMAPIAFRNQFTTNLATVN